MVLYSLLVGGNRSLANPQVPELCWLALLLNAWANKRHRIRIALVTQYRLGQWRSIIRMWTPRFNLDFRTKNSFNFSVYVLKSWARGAETSSREYKGTFV